MRGQQTYTGEVAGSTPASPTRMAFFLGREESMPLYEEIPDVVG